MKKTKTTVTVSEIIISINPIIFGCGSIFGSYPRLVFVHQDVIVTEKSRFVSVGRQDIGLNPKKVNHQSKTLHHRRHGVDRRD